MGLSSNVLWHQTKKQYFFQILKEKQLKYAYSLERVIAPEGGKEIAFPMISMCNLPLCEFSGYLTKYGGYSLGFKQEWAKKNGFSSVWYCDDTSSIRKSLVEDLRKKDINGDVTSLLVKVFAYIKLTEDEMPNRNYSNYRFADERELRSVPTTSALKDKKYKMLLPNYEYEKYKEQNGNPTIDISLDFQLGDLAYLIVPTEEDVYNVLDILLSEGIKHLPIFTHQQIIDDFIGQDHNKRISIVDTLTEDELLQAARKHAKQNNKDMLKQIKLLFE